MSKEDRVKAWAQWLMSSDPRVMSKGETFAEKVAAALVDRDYTEPDDLIGVVLSDDTFTGLVRLLVALHSCSFVPYPILSCARILQK